MLFETEAGDFLVKGGAASVSGISGFASNVRVGEDATIEENRGRTVVDAAQVGGNLEILKNSDNLEIEFNSVGGNAKIEDNTVPSFASILSNTVSENLQVYKNTGPGTKQVIQNTAGQIVQCFDNSPPFVGGPNNAPKKEGQCF